MSAEIDLEEGFVVSDVSQLTAVSLSTEATPSKLNRPHFSMWMRQSRKSNSFYQNRVRCGQLGSLL
jgi:hypothetical protein